MNNTKPRRHIVDSLFIISLLFLFVFSAILLIALGGSVYKRSIKVALNNSQKRVASSYVLQKIRQGDENGEIFIGSVSDTPAIIIDNNINGQKYYTCLYVHEGYLMELLASETALIKKDKNSRDFEITKSSGQKITKLQNMTLKSNLYNNLEIILTFEDGENQTVFATFFSET